MSVQPIGGWGNNLVNDGTREYAGIMGGASWGTTESQFYQVIPTGGTLSDLHIELSGTPGAGNSYVFVLYVDGAPSALTVTINDAETSDNDTSHPISVTAGQVVSLSYIGVSTPTIRFAWWGLKWTPTIADENICLFKNDGSDIGTVYGGIQGRTTCDTFENRYQQPLPTAGTFKKMYVQLDVDPGAAPDAFDYHLRENGGNTALTCTIVANGTTGNDTSNTVTSVAGDFMSFGQTAVDTPTVAVRASISCVFIPDTAGESIILHSSGASPSASATSYQHLWGATDFWVTTENQTYNLITTTTLKKLYVRLRTAPGSGKSLTFTLRAEGASVGAPGDLSVVIADAATTGNDTTNEYTASVGESVNYMAEPSGTPVVDRPAFGLVAFTAAVGWANIAKVNGVASADMAKMHGIAVADIAEVIGVAV